ncbi:MAG TPA: PAS domain-containing protein, partial [Myxococcaceae bacterium]|nr:PAS domain-containing protein [Myxococcaceae bacterium]
MSALETAFRALPEPTYLLDETGHVLACSQSGAQVLGHSPEALTGRRWAELAPDPEEGYRLEACREEALASRTARTVELRWPSEQGPRAHGFCFTPLEDEGARQVLVSVHPITQAEGLYSRALAMEQAARADV